MSNKIKLIIFDCDGVLIDSEHLACMAELEILKELGIDLSKDEYLELALGKKGQHVEKILYERTRKLIPPGFWGKATKKRDEIFQENLAPMKGVIELIEDLAVPFCIASSSDFNRLKFTLTLTGLVPYFEDRIFDATLVENGKPAPDIFHLASRKMQVPCSECLVIEDSAAGVQAAKSANMKVLGFTGGSHINDHFENKLKEEGLEYLFQSMDELKNYLLKNYPETLLSVAATN